LIICLHLVRTFLFWVFIVVRGGNGVLISIQSRVYNLDFRDYTTHVFRVLLFCWKPWLSTLSLVVRIHSCLLRLSDRVIRIFHVQDVLQGTQLLAIDVAAALGLLRRSIVGDELTEKEKQALRRTFTDLASVVPIGFLMLLPVSSSILLFHCSLSGKKVQAPQNLLIRQR